MGLWRVIAKNELKKRTSKFRRNRIVFFGVLYGILLVWAFILAPMLFDSFMPTIAESEILAPFIVPAIALIVEYLLMIFFLIIMIYPLNYIYRQTEIGHKEMLLAAPVTAGDIFFGEYVGKLPFISLYVLGLAPAVIGLINPLIDLTVIQMLVIYIDIFGMCIFALLLGSILTSWIEHKIANSEKYRDIAKALLMIMSALLVVFIYGLSYFFQFLMENPDLKNWLLFYPAHWFSNIILYILEPSLLDTYILNIWTSTLLAVGMPLLVFYLSYKKADVFYSLEGGTEKGATVIENESKFYGFFRNILGRNWEGLIIVQFKEFFRKKENITKIFYVVGIISFFGIVYPLIMPGGDSRGLISSTIFTLMRTFMGGFMISIIFGGYIFVGSKDLLWVYKKSPRNVNGLVYSYLFSLMIIILLMDIGLTIVFWIFLEFELIDAILSFVFFLLSAGLALALTIGVQSSRPAFEEKGKNMGGNMFLTVAFQMGQFVGFIFLIVEVFGDFPTTDELIYAMILLFIGIQAAVSIPVFFFGLNRLKKIE